VAPAARQLPARIDLFSGLALASIAGMRRQDPTFPGSGVPDVFRSHGCPRP